MWMLKWEEGEELHEVLKEEAWCCGAVGGRYESGADPIQKWQ